MFVINYKLFLFLMALQNTLCNIWDNMFSQMDSPGYIIPNEFKVYFTKNAKNPTNGAATPLFSISASTQLNLIKFSLYDLPRINNTHSSRLRFLPEVAHKNLRNPDSSGPSYTTAMEVKPSDPFGDKEPFVNVFLNFTNGTVIVDVPNYNCTWRNVSALKFITTKFILVSYDILTYYQLKDNIDTFIFTNPIGQKSNDTNILLSPIEWFKNFLKDLDLSSIVVFKVNPQKEMLEKIDVKYKNYELEDLNAVVNIFDKPDAADYAFYKKCIEDKSPNITSSVESKYKEKI